MTRLKYFLGFTIAASLALGMAGDSQASFWKKLRDRKNKKQHVAAFSVSGTFTGSIDGRIRVGNQEVIVTDETSIYVSGEGKEEVELFVRGASLYIGGMEKNGERTATFVVVRQSQPSFSQRSRSATDARYSVPSRSNPNVGQWVKGHE